MNGSILPLRLEGVSLEIGGKRLVKDVTCAFEPGLRTVIIGPNGAGKSLLLRLCHGLIAPSEGRVVWAGPEGRNARFHQAMVFQRPVMLRRSVRANIAYALSHRGLTRAEKRARIEEVLARTGLSRLAGESARALSIGEQQRLALARAWAIRPQVLFLDEATASLDPAATHAIEEIVGAIHAAGTRIVMTTHNLGQAKRMADDVMFINRGRVLEKAPADRFFTDPQNDLAQAFLRGELLWWRLGRDNRSYEERHQKAAQ